MHSTAQPPSSSLLRSFLSEAVRSQAVALQAAAASLLQHVYSEAEIDKQTNIQAVTTCGAFSWRIRPEIIFS